MKKIIVILLSAAALLCLTPLTALAEDPSSPQDDLITEMNDLLGQFDIRSDADDLTDMSFGDVLSALRDRLTERLNGPVRMLTAVFLVIVFGSVMGSAGGMVAPAKSADIYGMVCVMAAVTVMIPQLLAVYCETLRIVRVCGSFIMIFVPVLTTVSVGCGKFGSAGVYHGAILGASELIVRLSESYLMPILSVMAALGVTTSVFPGNSMDSLVRLIKKAVTWLMSVTMTLFTGFVTLKCTIAGKADGAASKTTKMLVSGFVPIVGGAVSDAYATVKGSFEVMSGTVGFAGILGFALIVMPIVLELLAYRAVMWAGSALADIFSADSISRLLKCFDSGLAIAQSLLVCYMLMFVVCSAIIMQTLG